MEQTHKHSVLWYRIYEPTSRFWIILLGFWKNGKTENWCQEWKDTRILLWRPHTIIPSWVWSQIWWSQNLQDWRYVSSFMLVSQISLDFRIFFCLTVSWRQNFSPVFFNFLMNTFHLCCLFAPLRRLTQQKYWLADSLRIYSTSYVLFIVVQLQWKCRKKFLED